VAELYHRVAVVTVGTTRVSGLRTSFSVKRTLRQEPNTARLSIWNLARETRKALQQDSVPVLLEAGYRDNTSQLFSGDLRNVTSVRDGPDWLTSFESGDGENAFRSARLSKALKSATFEGLLKEAAQSMGVGVGNALELAKQGKFEKAIKALTSGVTLSGFSRRVMDRLTRSAGLEWSIQDGQLQLLERGKALAGTAVLLTPNTGLIGSPEIGEGGVVAAKSLLQPDIFPGRKVEIRAAQVNGFYRVETITYDGDTHGTNWYVDMEASPL
jgi:hypothetical protein